MVRIPNKKENNKLTSPSVMFISGKELVIKSPTWAPRTAGILIKKDNLNASFNLYPLKRKPEVVIPERDIPGMIAKP